MAKINGMKLADGGIKRDGIGLFIIIPRHS